MSSLTPETNAVTRLGRYEILGRIASGGMATVYLARLGAVGGFTREFALKVVHPHLLQDDTSRVRFFAEARLASRVRHPNAVRTIDSGEDQGYPYLVLELIDGVNLRQLLLRRGRPLSHLQAAAIVTQVARGLGAVHDATDEHGRSLSMVHRDISPHNVMLDREGRAIVIDLGLAKAEAGEITQAGVLCGKLPYMSPEQARIEPVDAASDIFSLGTVLFELCTGELPFGEDHSTATLEALQRCNATAIAATLAEREVPSWLAEIVLVCLRSDKADRFASAVDLADALAQELQHVGADESNIRQSLATIVAESISTLGVTASLDATAYLRPQIHAIADEPEMEADLPPRSSARWIAFGLATVAVAGLVVAGTQALPFANLDAPPGTRAHTAAVLTSDDVGTSGTTTPRRADPVRKDTRASSSSSRSPLDARGHNDADADNPRNRGVRARRRAQDTGPDSPLKPNPYTPSP